jgi:hypothetical protein
MSVSTEHPDYKLYKNVWAKTRDAVKGSVAIKDKKHAYLPVPDNKSLDDARGIETVRYKQYLKRAVFTNFTGRTKNALVGAAFRKDPMYELPEAVDYLNQDATGDGLSLVQLAKDELSNLMETGRSLLLVDYPQADDDLSLEDVNMLDLRASIVPYTAEQCVNWKTSVINGRRLLTLCVLAEPYFNTDLEFSHDSDIQYRVLRLTDEGYSQQIYRDDKPVTDEIYPRKADGSVWEEIPLIFVGSKNNDSTIDDAPLSDIADVNVAHYRNSADYEESCFITGQPSLFITHSLTSEQFEEYNPDGLILGSRSGHVLGETGSAILLQASPNNLVMEAMKAKEQAMVMIGARIITDRGGNETAEGARIRFASENSAIGYVCEFMGVTGDYYFDINSEFYDKSVDPQMIMSMITLLDRNLIGDIDIFERLQAAGLIDTARTLDNVREERELTNPLG